MKAKKFLKKIKAICTKDNCRPGRCPMAVKKQHAFGETCSDCLLNMDEAPANWNIDKMVKEVKKL